MKQVVCRLALEDGTVVHGTAFGAQRNDPVCGEVIFNTSMTGYQEALTDPSYAGQILIMTAPEIGNVGVNDEDTESNAPQVAGFVVKELSRIVSNYRSDNNLSDWLSEEGIPCMTGVDTRALVRRIRKLGVMRGVRIARINLLTKYKNKVFAPNIVCKNTPAAQYNGYYYCL